MARILAFQDIDVKQIHISQPKKNRAGGLMATVTYGKTGGPLIFKSPKMPCPFGISEYTDKNKEVGTKWTLGLSFRYKDTNKEVSDFYDKLQEINEWLVDMLYKGCQEWFPQQDYDRNFIQKLCRPLITPSKKVEYAPTLNLRLMDREVTHKDGTKTRELAADVFNTNKERIDPRELAKGDSVITLITPGNVYLAGFNVGMTLKMQQAVRFPSAHIRGCAIEFSEDSVAPSAPTAPGAPTPAPSVDGDDTMDDASSPEESQYEEGELVPDEAAA
jgi:hypothetical protein